jgi:hypothetical protein
MNFKMWDLIIEIFVFVSGNVSVRCVSPLSVLSHGCPICVIDMKTVKNMDLQNIKVSN